MALSPIHDAALVGRLIRAAARGAPVPKALLGLGALVGVGLATVGLEILLDKLLEWPDKGKVEAETPRRQ